MQKACQKLTDDVTVIYIFRRTAFCQNDKRKTMCLIYKKGCFLRIFIKRSLLSIIVNERNNL